MTVHVGLIGCGNVAGRHIQGYCAIPSEAQITAVSDVVADNAARRAEEAGGVTTFADYHDMLAAADIDAVDICLPHHLHADAIVAAAQAGKQILCEKPLCLTTGEADRVRHAVVDAGVTLMCAHNQLFLPPVAAARELIDQGAIGPVYELRTTDSFFNNLNPASMGWRAHKETNGGGELIDTGYHPTYLLLHLAGARPVEVTAMISSHRLTFAEGEDSARVLVRFDSGAVGAIVTSWAYEPAPGTEKFSVVGEEGSLTSDGRSLLHKTRGNEPKTIEFADVDTSEAEIADFVRCLREGRRPIDTEAEGIDVLKVILAAYRSAETRRTVALTEEL